jgi:hypothetical protein
MLLLKDLHESSRAYTRTTNISQRPIQGMELGITVSTVNTLPGGAAEVYKTKSFRLPAA